MFAHHGSWLSNSSRSSQQFDEHGRAHWPTGELVVSGYITGGGFRTLTVGERVEVRYYRANQTSYKYLARWVRRIADQSNHLREAEHEHEHQ